MDTARLSWLDSKLPLGLFCSLVLPSYYYDNLYWKFKTYKVFIQNYQCEQVYNKTCIIKKWNRTSKFNAPGKNEVFLASWVPLCSFQFFAHSFVSARQRHLFSVFAETCGAQFKQIHQFCRYHQLDSFVQFLLFPGTCGFIAREKVPPQKRPLHRHGAALFPCRWNSPVENWLAGAQEHPIVKGAAKTQHFPAH